MGFAPAPLAVMQSFPARTAHDPNSGTLRPNRVKRLLKAGGTAFMAAGELNWTGDSIDAIGPTGTIAHSICLPAQLLECAGIRTLSCVGQRDRV